MKKMALAVLLLSALIGGRAAIGAADNDPSVSPARPTDEQVRELDARTGGADLADLRQAYASGLEQARTCTDEAVARVLKTHGIDVAVRSNAVEWSDDGFLGAFGLTSSDLDFSRIDKTQGQAALDEVGAAQARCVEDNVARAEADYQIRFKASESQMSASEDGFVQCVDDAADHSGDRAGSFELRSLARDLHEMKEGVDLRTSIAAAAADLSAKGVSDTAGPAVSAVLADCGQSWAAPFYGPDGRGGN